MILLEAFFTKLLGSLVAIAFWAAIALVFIPVRKFVLSRRKDYKSVSILYFLIACAGDTWISGREPVIYVSANAVAAVVLYVSLCLLYHRLKKNRVE